MSTSPPVPRLKKMVEMVLDENPKYRNVEVRNSDIALTIVIWQRWYSVGTNDDSIVHLYRLFDLPREDNVKRVRAVFQNTEHRFLPTNPDVLKKRGIEEQYWEEALGYKLTAEEWRRHHQTVKETTPPQIDTITEMQRVGETTIPPFKAGEEPLPTTKMRAIYLPKTYSNSGLTQNTEYEVEVEHLATGKPIKMLAPIEAVYPNLQSFGKTWKVVG